VGVFVPEVLLTAPTLPVAVDVEPVPVLGVVPAVGVLVAATLEVDVADVGVPEVAVPAEDVPSVAVPAVVEPAVVVPDVDVPDIGVPPPSAPTALVLAATNVFLASVWRSLTMPLRNVCAEGA
jgi:hypothetical protein